MALVELIKIDLAHRWQSSRPKRLADYVTELPELRDRPLPPDLIYEEYHLRRRAGRRVDPAEYTAAYPDQAQQLAGPLRALAFAAVYLLFRTLERDMAALEPVVTHGKAPRAADPASTV